MRNAEECDNGDECNFISNTREQRPSCTMKTKILCNLELCHICSLSFGSCSGWITLKSELHRAKNATSSKI